MRSAALRHERRVQLLLSRRKHATREGIDTNNACRRVCIPSQKRSAGYGVPRTRSGQTVHQETGTHTVLKQHQPPGQLRPPAGVQTCVVATCPAERLSRSVSDAMRRRAERERLPRVRSCGGPARPPTGSVVCAGIDLVLRLAWRPRATPRRLPVTRRTGTPARVLAIVYGHCLALRPGLAFWTPLAAAARPCSLSAPA